ncbi:magnesium chelatase subunit ChlI family protein [Henriciella aquimarina]|uniref:magnesium chelatase subunit ChlI family protein n=1 Tax=Henriciella aquimarina TaxID=545261 RepID=UPI003898FAC3
MSARAYHRVLKVARTIADLDGSDAVHRVHVAEALSYRRRLPDEKPPANATSGSLAQ